jgi:hypothetical protein
MEDDIGAITSRKATAMDCPTQCALLSKQSRVSREPGIVEVKLGDTLLHCGTQPGCGVALNYAETRAKYTTETDKKINTRKYLSLNFSPQDSCF